MQEFDELFELLTDNPPFPWQQRLFKEFAEGRFPSCDIPTGLGKTAVLPIWLIALAHRPDRVPRRLVYVVNRRTVVDQTTTEAEKLRNRLTGKYDKENTELQPLRNALHKIYAPIVDDDSPLAISTLRGQFADNREWSANPARPAIICGTVDMIGSRLLFNGYGCSFRSSPLHAGFLGHDALLIHDEAHLEPAFQELVESIVNEQNEGRFPDFDPDRRLKVMELTATSRNLNAGAERSKDRFRLNSDDEAHSEVQKRLKASKQINLHPIEDKKKLSDELASLALNYRESALTILIFARSVDCVEQVADKLRKANQHVETLTGTMRGLERDQLARCNPVFQRFLPESSRNFKVDLPEGTVYLICTSAGEVGIDISADHLVCDLTTFDSMVQRFGRVNRFGDRTDTCIDVVHPADFGKADKLGPYDASREKTLALLKKLEKDHDASPLALRKFAVEKDLAEAFAPLPTILPPTDILFDAWSLTTIREKLPGRPDVEPYLHGIADWEPPVTIVAWRQEVEWITGDLHSEYPPKDLLDDYPLKPHEQLQLPSDRAFKQFAVIARRCPDAEAWLVDFRGYVESITIADLADTARRDRIEFKTVLLPPVVGGLTCQGTLDGSTGKPAIDVADEWYVDEGENEKRRVRIRSDKPKNDVDVKKMRLVRCIILPSKNGGDDEQDDDSETVTWEWFERWNDGGRNSQKPVLWQVHVDDVVRNAKSIVGKLPLPEEIKQAIVVAAMFHDHGKRRRGFQLSLRNGKYPELVLAKSGKLGGRIPEPYRHEFGSLLDIMVANDPLAGEFLSLSPKMQDLVLQLIAAHHGRARPHFPVGEDFDPEPPGNIHSDQVLTEAPRRFARLQRQYGRWGLAYLESLLRAADWAASANPSEFVEEALLVRQKKELEDSTP